MADLQITLYGGAGEIGGNRILLEWDGAGWLLDFGIRFKATGKFFAEFVKPRTAALGLRDYFRMELLPPLEGLYRDDLWAHQPDLWSRYRGRPDHRQVDNLRGVLLSHAHMDHNGCLGFLRSDIPVYTGLVSAIIGKCLQDPKPTGADGEFCYLVPRERSGEILTTAKGPRIQRQHYICESSDEIKKAVTELREFWCSVPGTRSDIKAAPLELVDPALKGLKFWRVDHSIPGSGAFGIETPLGWVIYSGDLRTHGHSSWRTRKFVEEAAALKPALLIVEGTRVANEGSITEPEVYDAIEQVVAAEPGLVIADFSARNIERLRTFRDIAKARNRRLVVTTKDAYLLQQLHLIDPLIPCPTEEIAVLKEFQGTVQLWERGVHTGCAANLVDTGQIQRDPGGYIVCISYWDIVNLVDFEPSGGTYIYSASEAYDEEQKIDHQRLVNWLNHFGLKMVGGLPGAEKGPYHASGHIDGPALEGLIEQIGAERILPVHTQQPEWFERRWAEKIVSSGYGNLVTL
ncbi:MAG: exonuclease [Gemmatimonadales bacterium]|nr:exonuclease [Gemmatimonadales bacterium]